VSPRTVAPTRWRVLGLSAGHASADFCQGAVPAMIPFLVSQRSLSLTATTSLLVVMTVASSLLQPLFGWIADRRASAWLAPTALCLAGLGVALVAVVEEYRDMLLAVALSGLGVAAFHPEAARGVQRIDSERRATAMSVFALGGNAGFAAAPVVLTPAILLAGLPGAAVALLPTIACAALLLHPAVAAAPVGRHLKPRDPASMPPAGDAWGPFARLATIAALRSGVYFGLQAFIAAYFIEHLRTGEAVGNTALTIMLVAGAAGTLAGGWLADRFDRRAVLAGFMLAIPPLLALLLAVSNVVAAMVVVALVGFVTIGNFSLTVVMGQEYLPSHPGLASGITLGLAIGIGGLIAAALGPLADDAGIPLAIGVLAALPLAAAALAAALPPSAPRHSKPDSGRALPARPSSGGEAARSRPRSASRPSTARTTSHPRARP